VNYSIIQKSQLEGALRLDAEYYQPEYLQIRKNIQDLGFFNFSELIKSFSSGKNLQQTDDSNYPKFIRTQNVRPVLIDKDSMSYCTELKYPKLNYGDLLFVRVGEGVGNSSVVTKDFENSTFSDNVIRILIKDINPFYVSVLLNSKIGSLLMESVKKGSARSLISRENLNSLKIPKIQEEQQQYFEEIVNQAEKQILNSEENYSQAEDLLLEELGLSSFAEATEDKKDLSYIVNLSDIKSAHRVDAEYFQPKYDRLISKIKNQNAKLLLNAIENVPAKFNPQNQPEKKFKYVELANINPSIGVIDGFSEVLGKEAPGRAKRVLKTSDVIVSSVEGSLEKAALVSEEQAGYLASTGFFQFRSKEILPEVLLILAKSPVFQMQLQKQTAGTILTAVPKEAIKNVLVPILPKPVQQKIADLVQKSHEARKEAKELLEQAKQKVEKLIENKN